MSQTLYVIDGHSQIYRAYYAPFRDLTSPQGEPTRATYVFCSMLLKFIKERRPSYLAMAVDGPAGKLRRRAEYAEYKVTRRPMPEDFAPQVRRIMQIVNLMEIPILRAEGYEADDILATAAEEFASADLSVVLVSRDKDLDQLLREHVTMYDPLKDETIDAAAVEAQKGYSPSKAIEVQSLMGDDIDNVPGIRGVGPKTAARLIAQYGTAEAVIQHADELTPKLAQSIKEGAHNVPLAKKLLALERHVPIELDLEKMKFTGLRGPAIRPVFAELGFNRLLEQLDQLGIGGQEKADRAELASQAGQTTAAQFDYKLIDTPAGLEALGKELAGVKRLAVDTETTAARPMWCELVGVSLAWKPGHAVYLPVKGPLGAALLEVNDVRRVLGPVLADPSVEKVGHNLKYDLIALAISHIELKGTMFDTMIAAHVLDSTRPSYKLDVLAAECLNHRGIPIEDLIGRGKKQITMDAVPTDIVSTYSCEDADLTLRLAEVFAAALRDEHLRDLFERLEMPLLPVLAGMEMRGVLVDPEALKRMQTAMSKQADVLRGRILAAAAVDFNPDSPKQLATVLFEQLKLPQVKRTKGGESSSTDSDVLEELAAYHELPGLVLDYRKLTKLLGTYCDALAACIHPRTHRIHTSFHQAGTATGRLSSSDPNLQNIPIRTEEGRQIRSAFVADPGCLLLSADYSQVEIRMLAHLCQDPTLMEAFLGDQDIHRTVAAEVFSVPLEAVTPAMRARAKTVNFGIIYGQTAFGLAKTLRISRTDAGNFIAAYRKRFPRIDEFLKSCVAAARKQGYVETIFKRRRRIVDIDSGNPQRRALAERLAINSVVQGSAADLIKQAMINIAARIERENRPSRMLLQIHDELVFEVPREAVEAEKEMIVQEMSGAIQLRVPLKVDVGVGENWMDAK